MSLRKTLLAAVSTLGLLASPFAVSEETFTLRLAETWGPNSGLLGDAPRNMGGHGRGNVRRSAEDPD